MSIRKWTTAEDFFMIEAENKADAVAKGKVYADRDPVFGFGGNYKLESVRVVKKIQQKKK